MTLIEELRKAKGPDRALDNAIAAVFGFHVTDIDAAGWPLNYTASIDAAMTLAPAKTRRLVRDHDGRGDFDGDGKGARGFASIYSRDDAPIWTAYGATPAIALCIAALIVRNACCK